MSAATDSVSATGTKAGTVALVGRPNAGKSTLMNLCLAEKLAIVSDKPQTTRHRIVGILSTEQGQMVFFDTPGIHRPHHRLNQQMVRYSVEALNEADVVCLLVDASCAFGSGDRLTLELLSGVGAAKVLALNKIDLISKPSLLPRMAIYAETEVFEEIVPISARTGDGVETLMQILWRLLPVGEPLYDPELLTTHPERFLVAERIREKVLAETRDELPYTTSVLIEHWQEASVEDRTGLVKIYASILVERPNQKKILVGKGGSKIKAIGVAARHDLEDFLRRPVYLELHVSVEPGWRENPRLLARLERDLSLPGES